MKSIVKSTVMLSSLLLLTGCWDFGWSKKDKAVEKAETAVHGQAHEKASKCSHKGCTHDHSKDGHKKNHVKTQGMDDDSMDDEDDAEIQSMNDDDNDDEDGAEVQSMNADDEDDSDDDDSN